MIGRYKEGEELVSESFGKRSVEQDKHSCKEIVFGRTENGVGKNVRMECKTSNAELEVIEVLLNFIYTLIVVINTKKTSKIRKQVYKRIF